MRRRAGAASGAASVRGGERVLHLGAANVRGGGWRVRRASAAACGCGERVLLASAAASGCVTHQAKHGILYGTSRYRFPIMWFSPSCCRLAFEEDDALHNACAGMGVWVGGAHHYVSMFLGLHVPGSWGKGRVLTIDKGSREIHQYDKRYRRCDL